MLKSIKLKRILSLVFCLTILLSISSFALDNSLNTGLSDFVVNFLAEQGVIVSKNATLELVKMQDNINSSKIVDETDTSGYALCITEKNDSEVKVHVVLFYSEEEDGTYAIDSNMAMSLKQSPIFGVTGGQIETLGSLITSYATYSYDKYTSSGLYLRPKTLDWGYSKISSTASVSYMEVRYVTTDVLYTYPGLVKVTSGYQHVITGSAVNPIEGQNYYNYHNPLSSSYVISLNNIIICFDATINGIKHSSSCPVTDFGNL